MSLPRSPTVDEAALLDYLKDLGYDSLYLTLREEEPAAGALGGGVRGDGGNAPALETLEAVAAEASGCTRCRLAEGRQHVVFDRGSATADLMLIGEGPGAEEDRRGLAFVGAAGQLLDKILTAMGRDDTSVYIANIVKCRPPGNRDPQPDEVAACSAYLERQIDLVAPRVIVALGRVAAQTLLGTDRPLARLRGSWHSVRGVPARVTYHPAALLRNAALKRPTWEDMQVVMERLAAG
jgi:DNA polymerase